MFSWAQKRQMIILLIIGVVIALLAVGTYIFFIHKAPTCFDGIQNADEIGVDCGGVCSKICQKSVQQPVVVWSRAFHVVADTYSAVAYIENANAEYGAKGLTPYKMTIYGKSGSVIATRNGETTIQPNKRFAVFEGNIISPHDEPARVDFEFVGNVDWIKVPVNTSISVNNNELINKDGQSRLDATLSNSAVTPMRDVEVVALVYDSDHNAIGTSRTFIDNFLPGTSQKVVFTWPTELSGGTEACTKPVDVTLAIDRSGSMASDGNNPPEPMTSAKNAAKSFINLLDVGEDQVSVVSFATTASHPIDSVLSGDVSKAEQAVDRITIGTDGTQYTNVYDGLAQMLSQLTSPAHNIKADRIAVLLTDGDPNYPQKDGDDSYPKTEAIKEAGALKSEGVTLYTIGLGSDVNDVFLTTLASTPEQYLKAPTSDTLGAIYNQIATSICRRDPRVIEIITRLVPQRF